MTQNQNYKKISNKEFAKITFQNIALFSAYPVWILLSIFAKENIALKTVKIQTLGIALTVLTTIVAFILCDHRKAKYFNTPIGTALYGKDDYFITFLPESLAFSLCAICVTFIRHQI